jgi:hypothetical protein
MTGIFVLLGCYRRLVVSYRRFGKTYRPHLQGSSSPRPFKMGPIGCPETAVTDHQSTLCNIPEERRSNLHRGGSLISRKYWLEGTQSAQGKTVYHKSHMHWSVSNSWLHSETQTERLRHRKAVIAVLKVWRILFLAWFVAAACTVKRVLPHGLP